MNNVMLNDSGRSYVEAERYFHAAGDWASRYCDSFLGWDFTDVSDRSLEHDLIAWYKFHNEHDALLFKLKWT